MNPVDDEIFRLMAMIDLGRECVRTGNTGTAAAALQEAEKAAQRVRQAGQAICLPDRSVRNA